MSVPCRRRYSCLGMHLFRGGVLCNFLEHEIVFSPLGSAVCFSDNRQKALAPPFFPCPSSMFCFFPAVFIVRELYFWKLPKP